MREFLFADLREKFDKNELLSQKMTHLFQLWIKIYFSKGSNEKSPHARRRVSNYLSNELYKVTVALFLTEEIKFEGSQMQLSVNEVQTLENVFTPMKVIYENAYNSTLDADIYKIPTTQYAGHIIDT